MINLSLSPEMIVIIGKALGAQPYDTVAPVVAEMQKQINAQQNRPVEPSSPLSVPTA